MVSSTPAHFLLTVKSDRLPSTATAMTRSVRPLSLVNPEVARGACRTCPDRAEQELRGFEPRLEGDHRPRRRRAGRIGGRGRLGGLRDPRVAGGRLLVPAGVEEREPATLPPAATMARATARKSPRRAGFGGSSSPVGPAGLVDPGGGGLAAGAGRDGSPDAGTVPARAVGGWGGGAPRWRPPCPGQISLRTPWRRRPCYPSGQAPS